MGNNGGGGSWLSAVKRAFISPTKNERNITRRREELQEHEDEEKKRGKRRWIFRKPVNQETFINVQHSEDKTLTGSSKNAAETARTATAALSKPACRDHENAANGAAQEQSTDLATAMVASTTAAQAAVATVQAAVEAFRLSTNSSTSKCSTYRPLPSMFVRDYAAISIQTAFRGYLSRRALRALKALVKLQALVRDHNVSKRAKMTLRCMQALVRVQGHVLELRSNKPSHDGSLDSMSHFSDRKSISKEESSTLDDEEDCVNWDDLQPKTLEYVQAMLQKLKKAAASNREKTTLAYAISNINQQEELEEKSDMLDGWTQRKQWENWRASYDQRAEHIVKTVEMDTSTPCSYSPTFNPKRAEYQYQCHQYSYPVVSPKSPTTPFASLTRIAQVQWSSPRCYIRENEVPNYMNATASAKARTRSQSAPRHRPATQEREKHSSARKRLSFPVPPEPSGTSYTSDIELKSLTYKGITGGQAFRRGNKASNVSSCATDSDTSPNSRGELRRWLR